MITYMMIGIGEYVKDPALNKTIASSSSTQCSNNNLDSSTIIRERNETNCTPIISQVHIDDDDFSISSNAVIVNRATPQALAKATHYLIMHPDVCEAIGKQGRETIVSYYTIERQMKQYEDLYLYLHYNRDLLIY